MGEHIRESVMQERGNYDVRSLRRVKKFMDRLGGRRPSEFEIQRIVPDLRALFETFCEVRTSFPAANKLDLSSAVWELLAGAGIARREIAPLRKAVGS